MKLQLINWSRLGHLSFATCTPDYGTLKYIGYDGKGILSYRCLIHRTDLAFKVSQRVGYAHIRFRNRFQIKQIHHVFYA